MFRKQVSLVIATALGVVSAAPPLCAQDVHAGHAAHQAERSTVPAAAGQSAFAAIAEVVRLLAADAQTDWSKVNIEALRQHLIDMNNVVLHANVHDTPIASGARFDVTGVGATVDAIRRMAHAHAAQPDATAEFRIEVLDIPGGARLTVTSHQANDSRAELKIRALGFIGLLTLGEHHGPHHLGIARGEHGHGR